MNNPSQKNLFSNLPSWSLSLIPLRSIRRRAKAKAEARVHQRVASYLRARYIEPYLESLDQRSAQNKGQMDAKSMQKGCEEGFEEITKKSNQALNKCTKEENANKKTSQSGQKNDYNKQASDLEPKQNLGPKVIWQFWYQGIESAPEVVQICAASVKRHLGDEYQIIWLSKTNLAQYLSLPAFVYEKLEREAFGGKSIAVFSDLLRVELLAIYGGVWMDATLFLSGRPVGLEADCFAFMRTYPPPSDAPSFACFSYRYFCWEEEFLVRLCSSYLVARPKHPLMLALREILLWYWREEEEYLHYFLFQIIVFCLLDRGLCGLSEIASQIKANQSQMSFADDRLPHLLALHAKERFSQRLWDEIQSQSHIHKLTYYKDNPKAKANWMVWRVLYGA